MVPAAILGADGVTKIAFRVAAVTMTDVVPETPPSEEVMVTVPVLLPFTNPPLTEAIVLSDDTQVALAVRSAVVSSEKIPVAVNWMEVPLATLGFTGVISIALSVAAVTVAIVVPTTPFTDALIVELPWLTPVIRPWLPGVLLTDATAGADDDQVAELVRFTVDPSEKMPVAAS